MWEPEDGTDSMKEPDFLGGQCSGMEGAGLTYFGDFFFFLAHLFWMLLSYYAYLFKEHLKPLWSLLGVQI